jgi:hypothetical protein
MPRRVRISRDELLVLVAERATAPAPEVNLLLARHLQCKTSVRLAQAVTEAARCFAGSDPHPLEAPSELLPPLM